LLSALAWYPPVFIKDFRLKTEHVNPKFQTS